MKLSPCIRRYLCSLPFLFCWQTGLAATEVDSAAVAVPVESNLEQLLRSEDSNSDRQVTVEDDGPKRFQLESAQEKHYLVEGAYYLGNLVQALGLAKQSGRELAELSPEQLYSAPPEHLSRMISEHYWRMLTRSIDAEGLEKILDDPKAVHGEQARLYVPNDDTRALNYYREAASAGLDLAVVRLPENITPEYVKTLDDKPGLLSLALRETSEGKLDGRPFVVPGGRFNEMYGWDSYFIALGLIEDGRVDLAQAMVDNFIYQIEHYGKILNANRSYYLSRSQPPFLTPMALAVYEALPPSEKSKGWLAAAMQAAIHEYQQVWTSEPRLTSTGLSRYYGSGIGIPPEVGYAEFKDVLEPHAREHGLGIEQFVERYRAGDIEAPALDRYFTHDRAMRESGHDASYRLIGRATHLNPVSLNALLYKYERDIARTIATVFDDALPVPSGEVETSEDWLARAEVRAERMHELMWDSERGLFLDYDFTAGRRLDYVSATTLYPLWAGLATSEQAAQLVPSALALLEQAGGLAASSRESRGPLTTEQELKQWDYPFGWAPHQMLAWRGLADYGYDADAARLAYRWLHLIAFNAARHNGAVTEKYDVVQRRFDVEVAYGNVGRRFDLVPQGGFGWTNASFQVGRGYLKPVQTQALDSLVPPEWLSAQFSADPNAAQ